MIRKIIHIDEEKCNGCGACAEDCLPTCPTGEISFVEREAAAYDEKSVQENMRKKNEKRSCCCFPHRLSRQSDETFSAFTGNPLFFSNADRITIEAMALSNQAGTDQCTVF